jgi:hypothetical protein
MAGGHFSWRDKDTVTLFFSDDVINSAWLTDVRYERLLHENFTLGVAASLLGGPASSPLGAFAKNANLDVDLKYNF